MTYKEFFKYIGIVLIYSLKTFWCTLLNKKDLIIVKYHIWFVRRVLNSDMATYRRYREKMYQHLHMARKCNDISQQRCIKCEWYLKEGNDILEYLRYVYENDLIK